jgi:hypothetical protein
MFMEHVEINPKEKKAQRKILKIFLLIEKKELF